MEQGLFLRLRRDRGGLTLIEVLIAVALLAILGMALFQGLSGMALGQAKHHERTGALIAARAQVEAIKKAPYDEGVTSTPSPAYSSLATTMKVGEIDYELSITAKLVDTEVQLVTVSASAGGEAITSLQTYKVKR